MNARVARGWGLAACLVLLAGSGCTSGNQGIIRGQTPATRTALIQPAPEAGSDYMNHWGEPAPSPGCGPGCQNPDLAPFGMYSGMHHPAHRHPPYQHVLNHGGPYSASCCLYGGGLEGGHQPTHYHIYSYEQPRDLVYPPANTPAAIIQYPYYTTKGPDDFFLDTDG